MQHISQIIKDNPKYEPIAIGIGYNYDGTSYEYPIYSEKELEIIKKAGGQIKANNNN